MEFDETRPYQPGDEVRSIDWNVTARMGEPFIKRFVEERDLTIMFLVDMSASGGFGSVTSSKTETAAELCALLAFSAVKNNDKTGMLLFTDTVEKFVPPRKGASFVLQLIRELLAFRPRRQRTNIETVLEYFGKVVKRRCVVFLVSDFQDEGYEKQLSILSKRHDLIAVSVADPREHELPDVGLVELEDPETGQIKLIDTSDKSVRERFKQAASDLSVALRKSFRAMGIDHVEVLTDHDYVAELIKFFKKRERRLAV
ncbi:MAG: DUF58 domain-containing protein, partial [Lentisphaerae bacterium]|nr:DUF58 domain-containing protein [Lentisphaerota bacterium]